MSKENKTEYSFDASGTIVEWLIVGFAIYGFYTFISYIIN